MRNVLIGITKDIHSAFNTGELAYLLLTSKSELHLRDKLAFKLYSKYPKRLIAREWNRIDLAVIAKNQPKALIEIKLAHTAGVVRKKDDSFKTLDKLMRDIENAKEFALKATEIYGLLFLIHGKDEIPDSDDINIMKYRKIINPQLKKYGSEKKLFNEAKRRIKMHLDNCNLKIKFGKMDLGKAYGIGVDLTYVLIGPVFP